MNKPWWKTKIKKCAKTWVFVINKKKLPLKSEVSIVVTTMAIWIFGKILLSPHMMTLNDCSNICTKLI